MLKWLKKQNLLRMLLMVGLGTVSWILWGIRTKLCVSGAWIPVSCIVFVEEFLGIASVYLIVKKGDKTDMVCFAIGGAIGGGLGTYLGID